MISQSVRAPAGRCDLAGRLGARAARRRARRSAFFPVLGWSGRLTLHDVGDLLLVERLVLDETLGHQVQLLDVGFEDLLRARVVLLDNPSHFLIAVSYTHLTLPTS